MQKTSFWLVLALAFLLCHVAPLTSSNPRLQQLDSLMKVLDFSTHLEGDIDPDDRISLTTRIKDHVNGETYYITPVLGAVDGKFSYSHYLTQENSEGRYRVSGKADAQVENEHNLAIHVQNIKQDSERELEGQYARYAEYLRHYLEFLYTENITLDPTKMKNLLEEFNYYGSISHGTSPAVEASFQFENLKHADELHKRHSSVGGTQGLEEASISYAISNHPTPGENHSIQNTVATSNGDLPISGAQLSSNESPKGIESGSLGQALATLSKESTVTLVDSHGVVDGEGFSKNSSYSEEEGEQLATVGEVINTSEFGNYGKGGGRQGMLVGKGRQVRLKDLLAESRRFERPDSRDKRNQIKSNDSKGKIFLYKNSL